MKRSAKIFYALTVTAFLFSAMPACAIDSSMDEQNIAQAAQAMKVSGKVQLNFKELEMPKFIRFMSELLNENIVIDPSVKGHVSVVSPRAVSLSEARQIMLSVLEMNKLSIQDMGGYSKVTPIGAGPSTSTKVIKGDLSIQPGEAVAVQVLPLKYVKAGYITAPVKSALSDMKVTPLGEGNSVVLVGKAVQLNRAASIIRALDTKESLRSVQIITLNHADPGTLQTALTTMAKDPSSKMTGLVAVGDPRTAKLVIIGNNKALEEAKKIVKSLDVVTQVNNFHIYKLQNADAKVTAEQLNKILATAAKLTPGGKDQNHAASVVPDLATNSLLFTCTQQQYESMKNIIKEMDTQPRQVMLRGLIAEVNLNKLNSAGIDWAAWGGGIAGDVVAAGSMQLGNAGVPAEIMQLYGNMVKEEKLEYDKNGNAHTLTNTDGKALMYAYIKLLNKYDAINVLSVPHLMCTDNLESHLQVGQVIPQLKGTLTDTTNPSAQSNSYEYKDVGLILTVTPHIRNGNLVSLEIEQRTEDLLTTTGSTTPVTSKREIKTNVQVANGETIVIGGLIKEAEKVLKNRVPVLSYIPLIGNMFKSTEKQREKIDLMIFLTPYIVDTPADANRVTNDIVNKENTLSIQEKKQLFKNHTEYDKATRQESFNGKNLNTTSDDIKEEAIALPKAVKEAE